MKEELLVGEEEYQGRLDVPAYERMVAVEGGYVVVSQQEIEDIKDDHIRGEQY